MMRAMIEVELTSALCSKSGTAIIQFLGQSTDSSVEFRLKETHGYCPMNTV